MRAGERGKEGGRVRRMERVASSMAYDVVISWARGATLTEKGSSGGRVSAQDWTAESADAMTGGEMCFSVQGSRVTTMGRDLQSINQDFVSEGRWRRQR